MYVSVIQRTYLRRGKLGTNICHLSDHCWKVFRGHGVNGRDDHRHLVNLMDPELLKGLEPKLEQILTVVGIRTCHVLKVIGSKVKVVYVQVCECFNGLIHIQNCFFFNLLKVDLYYNLK